MEKRDIAITIQNMAQFDSVKSGIDELIKRGYGVDIYIPQTDLECGIGDCFDETYEILKNNYTIYRTQNDNYFYEVLMEPYPMDMYLKFNSKLRVKYSYYLLAAKPNYTYNAENNVYYDYIMCFTKTSAQYLDVYSKTVVLDNLKYERFKKHTNKNSKPILLYLPTYGESSSISNELIKSFETLKKDFHIITKKHHGTAALKDESDRISILEKISDEVYEHTFSLKELLEKTDVVLSDNSGAIFEALYNKIPVALFSKDLNINRYGDFDTYQYKYVKEKIFPYTSEAKDITKVVKDALMPEYVNKQVKLSDEIFYRSKNATKEFADFIEKLVKEKDDSGHKKIHDLFLKEYIDYHNAWLKMPELQDENNRIKSCNHEKDELIDKLQKELEEKNKALNYYEKGKLYQISKKIYMLNKKNR